MLRTEPADRAERPDVAVHREPSSAKPGLVARVPAPALIAKAVASELDTSDDARATLEQRLAVICRLGVKVRVTDNRHSMIHAVRRGGVMHARLHHMFLNAPTEVTDALGRFLAYRDREASDRIGQFIDDNAGRIRTLDRAMNPPPSPAGEIHDLCGIFADVNRTYFDDGVQADIEWGTEGHSAARLRTTIKLGSYAPREKLIRIHPRLDQTFVPKYFVAFVVFHEMLHHMIPPTRLAGRRVLHSAEFRAREKSFRYYKQALAWERANIDRLLATE